MRIRSLIREFDWLVSPTRARLWWTHLRYPGATSRDTKRESPQGGDSGSESGPLATPRLVLEAFVGRRIAKLIVEAWGR